MSRPTDAKKGQEWYVDISGSKSVSDYVERSDERRKQLKADLDINRRLRPYGRRDIDNPNRSSW